MKIRIGKHHTLDLIKFVGFVFTLIMLFCALWFIASYIDVMWYQLHGGTDHQWNLFVIFNNYYEAIH